MAIYQIGCTCRRWKMDRQRILRGKRNNRKRAPDIFDLLRDTANLFSFSCYLVAVYWPKKKNRRERRNPDIAKRLDPSPAYGLKLLDYSIKFMAYQARRLSRKLCRASLKMAKRFLPEEFAVLISKEIRTQCQKFQSRTFTWGEVEPKALSFKKTKHYSSVLGNQ